MDREDELVESALARIRRAKAKRKQEVELTKDELDALERRRKLMEEEERRRRRDKEPRFAVPISHLEPVSRKTRVGGDAVDDPPRRPMPGAFIEHAAEPGVPPMGYFPPPNASRSRPPSDTVASQRPPSHGSDRDSSESPFRYSYVRSSPPATRHVSDTASPPTTRHISDTAPPPRSTNRSLPHKEQWLPNPRASASASAPSARLSPAIDPFQFMTAGPRAPYHDTSAAAAHRRVSGSGPSADTVRANAPPPATARGPRHISAVETSDESTEEGDSENDHTRRVDRRSRTPEGIVVVESSSPDPEPEPQPDAKAAARTKKSAASTSPVIKRKSVGGRRRKGR